MDPILPKVLLVEDNQADVLLTRESFRRSKFLVDIDDVSDGDLCLAYLRNQPPYENKPKPDVILLDLNMPRMGGKEVLQELHNSDTPLNIPIIVMTTSESDKDIQELYDLGCNSYIVKPITMDEFVKVVKSFYEYWFTIVKLPPKNI